MKKTLLLSLMVFQVFQLFAQRGMDCRILDVAVHDKAFVSHFQINKSNDPLIIIDTNSYFTRCNFIHLETRVIKISHNYPQNVNVNKGSGKENRNKIIIYNVASKGKCFNISFWQPYGNANMILRIKLTKKKAKVKVISLGVF